MESTTLKRLLAGHISGHHVPLIYCLFKKIEYLDTTGARGRGGKRVPTPDSQETYVLCRTAARREKEKAIRSRFSARIEKALGRLTQRVATGGLKDRGKTDRRLGRIQARCPQVADLYPLQVVEAEGRLRLQWGIVPERRA